MKLSRGRVGSSVLLVRSLPAPGHHAVLALGCAVGPAYRRPPITTPDRIRGQEAAAAAAESAGAPPAAEPSEGVPPAVVPPEPASLADRTWWEILQDGTLQALIDEALQNGHDVRLAAWRIEEARANAGIARSEFFPQIQGGAGWSRGRQSRFFSPVTDTIDLYDINLGFSWEIDLWGRIRRLNEAALARYLATEEARRGVLLSLVSEVATSYFRLRALDVELEIARRTAAAFRETHDLFDRRLEAGTGSALETSSAAASLATTAAAIPDLERLIVEEENRLAFLLGRAPGPVERGAALEDQILPPAIPVGLPADLLKRRPDLRQSEQELIAANADVGVAVADFFPRLSLTGVFGGVAPQVSDLFSEGKTWSAGGGLLTPLFQGRRLKNRQRAAVARWEQAKVRYERDVSNAFAEVSNALVAYAKLAVVEREREAAVAAHRDAVALANTRYLSGLSDYLEVLEAQRQLFPAENALAQTRFDRLAVLVAHYRALGGGWQLPDDGWLSARNGTEDAAHGTETAGHGTGGDGR
jgi:multidrug efflux system outer membrane protein